MLRPASRRAGRRSASAYERGQYGPAEHERGQYGPAEHERGRHGAARHEPGQYGHEPGQYGNARHEPGWYGPAPFDPEATGELYVAGAAYAPHRYDSDDAPHRYDSDEDTQFLGADGPVQPAKGRGRRKAKKVRKRRIRRLLRLRTVRVILALIAVFLCWVTFSVGQALAAPGGGSVASKVAEWARDHYLGPMVTFAEWLTYNPPKVGGTPGFSLAVPSGAAPVAPVRKYRHAVGFVPNIPEKLTTFAGKPLPGEGVWRVLEKVNGEPAIFGTFLRPSAVYSSYVAGIVSMDQRLVKFQLHPGSEDPGPGNWKAQPWIPPGSRTGLLATFNGGFKLDVADGGFYLNGVSKGTLVKGAASVVYYRDGTIKIGSWGSEVKMTPNVVGVRQNLKLLIDHGKIPASVNQNVIGAWGATLGGGYYVWRSGLGITAGGRVIYVYGPALNVEELAMLLRRAGAVEGMQLDINPFWMSYEYYKAGSHPADPTPVNLLPSQQQTAYRYYSIYSRDFTAVYSR